MNKGLVIVNKGVEHVAAAEIKELIGNKKIDSRDTLVIFNISKLTELCTVCYRAQSISRAMLLLDEIKISTGLNRAVKEVEKSISSLDLDRWFKGKHSFSVDCCRIGNHDFNSVDISGETARLIIKKYPGLKTDYNNPQAAVYIYVYDDMYYLGIDFAGIDLAKRQYKIFNHPESLKGTTGYVLIRESGFSAGKALIDPFMGSGIIVIEAALYALDFPVRHYDGDKLFFTTYDFFKKNAEKFFDNQSKRLRLKVYGYDSQLRYLQAAKKNAKLAGISDNLSLSKLEVEWLDTKFNKCFFDCIVTDPPRFSKNRDEKQLTKVYNEFFYQADYILKNEGTIVLLCTNSAQLIEAAEKHKFIIKKELSIFQGKEEFKVLVFERV